MNTTTRPKAQSTVTQMICFDTTRHQDGRFSPSTLSVLFDIYVHQCTIWVDVHICPGTAGSSESYTRPDCKCSRKQQERIVWYHILTWCKGGLWAGKLFGWDGVKGLKMTAQQIGVWCLLEVILWQVLLTLCSDGGGRLRIGINFFCTVLSAGSISVWDLHTRSSLLRSCSADSRTVILRPFRTLSAHLLPVTSVAFSQRAQFMLASCSMDRSVNCLLMFMFSVLHSCCWYIIWNDNFYTFKHLNPFIASCSKLLLFERSSAILV